MLAALALAVGSCGIALDAGGFGDPCKEDSECDDVAAICVDDALFGKVCAFNDGFETFGDEQDCLDAGGRFDGSRCYEQLVPSVGGPCLDSLDCFGDDECVDDKCVARGEAPPSACLDGCAEDEECDEAAAQCVPLGDDDDVVDCAVEMCPEGQVCDPTDGCIPA